VGSKINYDGEYVGMTCREFEHTWNELLDAEASVGSATQSTGQTSPAVAERERALLEHAAGCPSCGEVSARYRTLRRAIRAWGPPPAPSAGLTDRILAETQRPTPSAWPIYGTVRRKHLGRFARATLAAFAATVATLAFALPLLNRTMNRAPRNGPPDVLHITHVDPGHDSQSVANARALNMALTEATAATWDLARSASEPAARISRQALDAATGPDRSPAQPASVIGSGSVVAAVSVPSLDSLAPDTAAAGAMLLQVSDRLINGVRPLSDTARHAFGFLLGTALAKPEVPVDTPAQKGA
jgi:hypothetical protein